MRSLLVVSLLAAAMVPRPARAESPPVSAAAGLALGASALHVGSGEHPLAPLVGVWGRVPLGAACYLEPEAALSRRSEGGDIASFDRRCYRAALGLGCSVGTRATRVALSVGPSLSYRFTRIDGDGLGAPYHARSFSPGLRYRAGFLIPVAEHLQIDLLAGGATHGRVFDHDLVLQGGVRW